MAKLPLALLIIASLLPGSGRAEPEGRHLDLRQAQGYAVRTIAFKHLAHRPYKDKTLRAGMRTRKGQPFARRFFRSDLAALADLYRSAGYLGVQITTQQRLAGDKLHLTLLIDSKEPWLVDKVSLELSAPFDSLALQAMVKVQPGDIFRYGEVLRDERQLQSFFSDAGYAGTQVRNQIDWVADQALAQVRYLVHPGRKSYFGHIDINAAVGARLHTRRAFINRYITFKKGMPYDPNQVQRTRSQLLRTDLFRSVTLKTSIRQPSQTADTAATANPSAGDSLLQVQILLQEKKYRHIQTKALFNSKTEAQLGFNTYHNNWLGQGKRVGVLANLGRPLQQNSIYLTEPNLYRSGVDLTLSLGRIDEWDQKRVSANQNPALAVARLPPYDPVLAALSAGDQNQVADHLQAAFYTYQAAERRWLASAVLSRLWGREGTSLYLTRFSINLTRAKTRPVDGQTILYQAPASATSTSEPFARRQIPADNRWRQALTDAANTLDFVLEFSRDRRDNPILPTKGHFLRAISLYALQFSGRDTRVIDEQLEGRYYFPLGKGWVWAQALRLVATTSLRSGRPLPQVYWKELGGEGSVRGVERNSIQVTDGGRLGLNWRNEVRFRHKAWGLVLFWDRAGVWRHGRDVAWADMEDGYGLGLRYIKGIPFRLDLAWSGQTRRARPLFYLSIGQAF